MKANYTNPKCGVCLDTKQVPEMKQMQGIKFAYKVTRMIPCPYCTKKVK